jgi:hypothetical protein
MTDKILDLRKLSPQHQWKVLNAVEHLINTERHFMGQDMKDWEIKHGEAISHAKREMNEWYEALDKLSKDITNMYKGRK